jgi:hypothetical protein
LRLELGQNDSQREIPCFSQFDVQKIPDMLRNMPCSHVQGIWGKLLNSPADEAQKLQRNAEFREIPGIMAQTPQGISCD